jgi:hypothetical protein
MPNISIMLEAIGSVPLAFAPPAAASALSAAAANPIILFAAAVAWAAIWANVVVIPFYAKPERLHLDYHSSGKLNAALSAIEANQLIPALAQMFNRALEAKADRRTKLDKEAIESLLQEVQFLPDLEAAQQAMILMERLRGAYNVLHARAGWLWQWGLSHSICTLAMTVIYAYLFPIYDWAQWLLWATVGVWVLTLFAVIWQMRRFSKLMSSFIRGLESHGGD